jgi:hypothetical protein
MSQIASDEKQKFAKQFVRITTILYALLLLPSIGAVLSILDLFSEPGAFGNRGYWFMGIDGLTLPVVLILSIFGPRMLNKEKEYKYAVRMALLPVLNAVIYLFGLLLSRVY